MRNEVRRGRKFIEYHDPDTQDENTFTQEISGADVSYQDEQGIWRAIDENWTTDGLDGYIVKADKLNHKVRLKGNGGRSWYPRRNVISEYITFGIPQYWTGSKWNNFRFSGWSVSGKTITLNTRQNVTILVHSRWNGVKIDWVLASSQAPIRMRYSIALTGITESDGMLYGADGTRLAQLTPTTATDANGAELPCTGSFANGYVEFSTDVSGAVFPVTIDPDYSLGTTNYGDFSMYPGGEPYYNGLRNYGANPTFNIQNNVNFIMRFDLSSISSGSTCTDVALKITKTAGTSTNNRTYYIYSLAEANTDWIEGTKNGSAASYGEPCYDGRKADGAGGISEYWAGSGGCNTSGTDYEPDALMSVTQNSADPNPTQYTWTFNATGVARVQDWFGGITKNYGMMIKGAAYGESTFATNNNSTASYRPVLSVTYTSGTLLKVNMNGQMQNLSGGFN